MVLIQKFWNQKKQARVGNGSESKEASKPKSYVSINKLGLEGGESGRNYNPQMIGESLLRMNNVDESLRHYWK
jgi:hypothetical protein